MINLLSSFLGGGAMYLAISYISRKWINHLFDRDIEKYKKELETQHKRIQLGIDAKLEKLKVEYSNIYTERLEVFKTIIKYLSDIKKCINILSSYHMYECKPNIDFDEASDIDENCSCDDYCIKNYWKIVTDFRQLWRDMHLYYETHEMFFSLQQCLNFRKIDVQLAILSQDAILYGTRPGFDRKVKAYAIFEMFHTYDLSAIEDNREQLIESFRSFLGVPTIEH